MNISTKATNLDLTADIEEYLEKRLSAFKKFIHPEDTTVLCDTEVEKTIRQQQHGEIFRAEINLHIGGKQYRAEANADRLYDAIDEVQKKVLKELRRDKDKQMRLLRRGGAQVKDFLRRLRGR